MLNNLINRLFCAILPARYYAKWRGIKYGRNCVILTYNWPSETYLIRIGNKVEITAGVRIHTHGGGWVVRDHYPDFDAFGKVIIEDNVYIGSDAQIMPGVTIGKGSLVAAGSIVTKSVPAGVVVAGNPAKIVSSVDDYIERNVRLNLHCKRMSFQEKKRFLLAQPEDRFIRKSYLTQK